MKIVAILGSPHHSGNGATALAAYLDGAKENGNEIVTYELATKNVKYCLGCRQCIKNGGVCVQQDDFAEIFEAMKAADLVVMESPIYINQMNGLSKNFLDRCYPLADENHKPRFGKRGLVMIWTYAVPLPLVFLRYIKSTAKALKAMGFVTKKIIILPGCTTLDRVKKDRRMMDKLVRLGTQTTKQSRSET